MAISNARHDSPDRDVVSMCYAVAVRESGRTRPDMRIRFEFREDLASGHTRSQTVIGIDAACLELRSWLEAIEP